MQSCVHTGPAFVCLAESSACATASTWPSFTSRVSRTLELGATVIDIAAGSYAKESASTLYYRSCRRVLKTGLESSEEGELVSSGEMK